METSPAFNRSDPFTSRVATRPDSGLETGGWQPSRPTSFQPRAANDDVRIVTVQGESLPPWVAILCGAVLAAAVGALLGGALHI